MAMLRRKLSSYVSEIEPGKMAIKFMRRASIAFLTRAILCLISSVISCSSRKASIESRCKQITVVISQINYSPRQVEGYLLGTHSHGVLLLRRSRRCRRRDPDVSIRAKNYLERVRRRDPMRKTTARGDELRKKKRTSTPQGRTLKAVLPLLIRAGGTATNCPCALSAPKGM